ncbi:Major Facilitator Superfamily protein [Pseudooceanicola marinus]|uniref:Major Facilitator Superfamily protein n=1 Tax=Pseudooceanicola marinus TaxID=396013 RepID=A0A1X6YPR4_9RHOB|nr:MFS transporter [Pseudooceanicola marinus]PJE29484.1 MFS transporter [Pseudooceanicola marinus]SLN26954.1 Major Facilitator Superfamily protein [Pseudooceanicola marinus]
MQTDMAQGEDGGRRVDWPLIRWYGASATLLVPQAAGPVAFSLLALALTGDESGGAALILAMTLAQVAGAVPFTRLGARFRAAPYMRALIGLRTLALLVLCLGAALGWPLWALAVCAALSGSVSGAAYGMLRALLNQLTPEDRYPRALGIAATLNEVSFVASPVLAAGLGGVSPLLAVLALSLLGGLPALLVPDVAPVPWAEPAADRRGILSPPVLLWLACAAAGGAAVATLEIGAVALALRFGHAPTMAILITVPLCVASVCGGLWVSWRNRMAGRAAVVAQLAVMALGCLLAATGLSLGLTVAGAVMVGAVLPPLGTTYMLLMDRLVPAHRRAEAFSVLRTANLLGVILASGVLAVVSLGAALVAVTLAMAAVTLAVALSPRAMGQGLG